MKTFIPSVCRWLTDASLPRSLGLAAPATVCLFAYAVEKNEPLDSLSRGMSLSISWINQLSYVVYQRNANKSD